MVSDELRNFKPYAIPVRVLKYTSLTDKNARDLKDELKSTMEDMGMVTVGMFKLYNYFIIFNYWTLSSIFLHLHVISLYNLKGL